MNNEADLATLLNSHMKRASVGDARLSNLANSITGKPNFLHRSTLRNWRDGSAQKVNNWRQLVTVAAALHLNKTETDALLKSGGCPPIVALAATAPESDQALLKCWQSDTKKTPNSATMDKTTSALIQPVNSLSAEPTGANADSDAFSLRSSRWKVLTACTVTILGILTFGYWWYKNNGASTLSKNSLVNSNFDDGIEAWTAYVNDSAIAEFSVENERMLVQIKQSGNKSWHIQLFQHNLAITAGQSYTVRFRIRGNDVNQVKFDVTRALDPKISLGFDDSVRQTIEVSNDWATKTIEFEANKTVSLTEGGARVLFDMGKSKPGTLVLDDIEFFNGKL